MNPNPDPQPESTVEPQKPLMEMLDEIELAVARSKEHCDFAETYGDALVKALRRAMHELEMCRQTLDRNPANYNPRALELEVAHEQVVKAVPDIAAILNQGRK